MDRRIPEWLAPYKNEWRSMSTMQALFNTYDRPMSKWLEEIRPRLRCIAKPAKNRSGIARYYLVKQIWACALAHGVKLIPSPALTPKEVEIAMLKEQLADRNSRLIELANRKPEVRVVRPADYEQMLTTMLTATEPRPLPGVYFLISEGVVTYVGQSQNVLARMSGHTGKTFDTVKMIHIPDPSERMAEEGRWILAFAPRNNVAGLPTRKEAA